MVATGKPLEWGRPLERSSGPPISGACQPIHRNRRETTFISSHDGKLTQVPRKKARKSTKTPDQSSAQGRMPSAGVRELNGKGTPVERPIPRPADRPEFGHRKRPWDFWLEGAAVAIGIIFFLVPYRSPVVIVSSLLFVFALLAHPIWHFHWVEGSKSRRWGVLSATGVLLALLGYWAWPQSPDLSLVFVQRNMAGLGVVNNSAVSAVNPEYTVLMWNLDDPRNRPNNGTIALPHIKQKISEFVRPRTVAAPINFVEMWEKRGLVRRGNRLFGMASVDCLECPKRKDYFVYIHVGLGGWYSEALNEIRLLAIPALISSIVSNPEAKLLELVPRPARAIILDPVEYGGPFAPQNHNKK